MSELERLTKKRQDLAEELEEAKAEHTRLQEEIVKLEKEANASLAKVKVKEIFQTAKKQEEKAVEANARKKTLAELAHRQERIKEQITQCDKDIQTAKAEEVKRELWATVDEFSKVADDMIPLITKVKDLDLKLRGTYATRVVLPFAPGVLLNDLADLKQYQAIKERTASRKQFKAVDLARELQAGEETIKRRARNMPGVVVDGDVVKAA